MQQKVLIAIPTVGDSLNAGLGNFLWNIGKARSNVDVVIKSGSSCITSCVEYQRNLMVDHFLDETTCDVLWFIDSDTKPTPDSFKLIDQEYDCDIWGGVYGLYSHVKETGAVSHAVWSAYDSMGKGENGLGLYLATKNLSGINEVAGLATGCMLIKRHVLEDNRLLLEEGTTPRAIFRTPRDSTGRAKATDDLDFCYRVTELGYKIKADMDIRWGHLKPSDVKDIFNEYVTQYGKGFEDGGKATLNMIQKQAAKMNEREVELVTKN